MLLITGANGRVGRLVVEALVAAGERPRVFVRDSSKATANFHDSVDVFAGDLEQPATLRAAMQQVSGVFLCSPVHPNQVIQQNAVIDAARTNGSRVVKLSGLATWPGSFVDSGRWHAETETYLAKSGLPYTCLHPYFFMQNLSFQLAEIRKTGILKSAVKTGSIAMVDAHDIAGVAAALLRNPDLALGETLPLTSGESLTYDAIAATMSTVLGLSVRFEAQALEEVEKRQRASGQPEWHINILLQFNRAFEEGLAREVHPAVANILGRPPISLAQYLARGLPEKTETQGDTKNPFPT
ncbi:MAG: NmrA family NAD(P)-binding protein [Pseudomonadota bacterium]